MERARRGSASRRWFLELLGASVIVAGWPRLAGATLVRGLTLEAISRGSDGIVVGTPLDARSHWQRIAGRQRIVTDTRVRVERVIAQRAPESGVVVVRTHGGVVGKIGELVHGEPELVLGVAALLFLRDSAAGVHHVLGMAQGHFPLQTSARGIRQLTLSTRLPELVDIERSAVRRLAGRELGQAEELIKKALMP